MPANVAEKTLRNLPVHSENSRSEVQRIQSKDVKTRLAGRLADYVPGRCHTTGSKTSASSVDFFKSCDALVEIRGGKPSGKNCKLTLWQTLLKGLAGFFSRLLVVGADIADPFRVRRIGIEGYHRNALFERIGNYTNHRIRVHRSDGQAADPACHNVSKNLYLFRLVGRVRACI